MRRSKAGINRRRFLASSAAAGAAATLVPRHVLGRGQMPPSESLGGALIGCGARGEGTFRDMGPDIRMLAQCDVRFLDRVDNETYYTDYRRLLERTDVDVVAIATPPGWHALIAVAAMEAGKDVFCEKPATRFIGEGRAMVEAEHRYQRVFQICTFGRFRANRRLRKLMASGLLEECPAVVVQRGGFKVAQHSGRVRYEIDSVPEWLDWDMYCGPALQRPFHHHRFGGYHRNYWDYDGGGLADMAQHYLDGFNYEYAKDFTSPVEVEAFAPPAHPEACGMWGWVELRYADGLTLVLESDEWGGRTEHDEDEDRPLAEMLDWIGRRVLGSEEWGRLSGRRQPRDVSEADLDEAGRRRLAELPDPEPLLSFLEAVRTRQQAGGHAEAAHRTATLFHLANVAIRTGRKLRYDPEKEVIVGDEEANRLVHQPMRAPWRV